MVRAAGKGGGLLEFEDHINELELYKAMVDMENRSVDPANIQGNYRGTTSLDLCFIYDVVFVN